MMANVNVIQIGMQEIIAFTAGIGTIVAGITKLFTSYLKQRDEGWQEALKAMAENIRIAHADNKELVNVMVGLMKEYAKAILGKQIEPKPEA